MSQSLINLAFGPSKVWSETALSLKQEVKATSPTVKAIEVVNSGNQGVYVKGYFDLAANVTEGTTDPNFIRFVPALKTRRFLIPGAGLVCPTALTVACRTTGGTAGTTAPTVPPAVKIVYS